MITNEMTEVVQANVLATHTEAHDVATALYPLIRAQVLEDAAKFMETHSVDNNSNVVVARGVCRSRSAYANAIRDMKEK